MFINLVDSVAPYEFSCIPALPSIQDTYIIHTHIKHKHTHTYIHTFTHTHIHTHHSYMHTYIYMYVYIIYIHIYTIYTGFLLTPNGLFYVRKIGPKRPKLPVKSRLAISVRPKF